MVCVFSCDLDTVPYCVTSILDVMGGGKIQHQQNPVNDENRNRCFNKNVHYRVALEQDCPSHQHKSLRSSLKHCNYVLGGLFCYWKSVWVAGAEILVLFYSIFCTQCIFICHLYPIISHSVQTPEQVNKACFSLYSSPKDTRSLI